MLALFSLLSIYLDSPIILDSYLPILPYENLNKIKGTHVSSYGYPLVLSHSRGKTINVKAIQTERKGFVVIRMVHRYLSDSLGFSGGPTIVNEGEFSGFYIGVNQSMNSNNEFWISYSKELADLLIALTSMDFAGASEDEIKAYINESVLPLSE